MAAGNFLAAAWTVDATRLRLTLEQLAAALRRYSPSGGLDTPASYASARVLEAVRLVVSAASKVDFSKQSPWAPPAVGSLLPYADRLGRMLLLLPPAWHELVSRKIGPTKLGVLNSLLAQPSPDLLGILGRSHDENSHSDVLRWLLHPDTAPTVAPAALTALARYLDPPGEWMDLVHDALRADCLSVRREYIIGLEWDEFDFDRIDLVVSGPRFVLAIENKISAPEHNDQTQTYWHWLEQLDIRSAGIYLTPTGVPAVCPRFIPLSYLDILACLLEGPLAGAMTPEEATVLAAYVRTLANHVLRAERRGFGNTGGAP